MAEGIKPEGMIYYFFAPSKFQRISSQALIDPIKRGRVRLCPNTK
jgi:hypothetical protein